MQENIKVKDKLIIILKSKAKNGIVILHSKLVHRELIPDGLGSCSVDRYLRKLRQDGIIEYDDPRRNNYFYVIKIKEVK